MKNKTEKEYVAYISETIKTWVPRLLLQNILVGVQKDEKEKFLASRYRYPYMDAQVLWTDNSFKSCLKDPNQEHEIVHEMCHVITDPFYTRAVDRYTSKDSLEDERERLTDQIAIIAFKSFK